MNATKVILLSATLLLAACEKEHPNKLKIEQSTTVGSVTKSTWSVNWNTFTHGTTYTSSEAVGCFGNVTGWNDARAYISNGTCRIASAEGIKADIDIAAGKEYEVDYDVRFHSQFTWNKGGKLGFGFSTGVDSVSLAWNRNAVFTVSGKHYPSRGSLNRGQWYHIHLYVRNDGKVLLTIDGKTVLNQTGNWSRKEMISKLTFHTSQEFSESAIVDYIYYDNLKVHKIN